MASGASLDLKDLRDKSLWKSLALVVFGQHYWWISAISARGRSPLAMRETREPPTASKFCVSLLGHLNQNRFLSRIQPLKHRFQIWLLHCCAARGSNARAFPNMHEDTGTSSGYRRIAVVFDD